LNVRLLGPDGVQRRIAEIENRLSQVFPDGEPPPSQGPSGALRGAIGGFSPFDPMGADISWRPARKELRASIESAARQAGVDPNLLEALVEAESAFDPGARSRAGAMGLTQLMPGTAQALGVSNPFDPVQSLNGGARYLSQMMSRFNGDLSLALAAYNAGPGAVDRFGGIPPYAETQAYVRKVLALYGARRSGP